MDTTAAAKTTKRPLSQRTSAAAAMRKNATATTPHQNLRIAVIVEPDEDGERLIRELQRLRCEVRHIWPIPPQLPVDCDLVFCTLVEDMPKRIPWLPGEPEAGLVLVDRGVSNLDLKLIHNCAAHGVLHYPVVQRAVQTCVALAREHFLYERRLRNRIDKLDENLRTMRLVERAKSLLVRVKNVSEEEAYNYLRRQAMERRVTIGAVANAIIDSHELLS
ncbi:ANTAR domain-containing response regulator [Roseibium algicola]|nr:ANTAR domain-containing protein [Roseibium aggregatum]